MGYILPSLFSIPQCIKSVIFAIPDKPYEDDASFNMQHPFIFFFK